MTRGSFIEAVERKDDEAIDDCPQRAAARRRAGCTVAFRRRVIPPESKAPARTTSQHDLSDSAGITARKGK